MARTLRTLTVTLTVAVMAACAGGSAPDERLASDRVSRALSAVTDALPSPAIAGSGEPRLFGAGDRVHMSWIEPAGQGHAIRTAALTGRVWSDPITVFESDDLFVNWADFPSIVQTDDGSLFVHWLQRSGAGTYAYDVRMSVSRDNGRSWSVPFSPHDDGTHTEHGFVTLVPDGADRVTAVWLDGRSTGVDPGSSGHAVGGSMTLRAATVDASGGVADGHLLDARTCDCCQTGAVRVGGDLVVVYRDRSDEEIRDIWSVSRREGLWQAPVRLSRDDWMIPGCPVNGPAISARGTRLAVAWFALVDGAPEVKVAFSDDAGLAYSAPVLLERGAMDAVTLGRVGAAWIDDDTVVVTWMTGIGEAAEIRYATIDAGGQPGSTGVVGVTRATRSSGFPQLVAQADRLVFAWTVPGEAASIQVAGIDLR